MAEQGLPKSYPIAYVLMTLIILSLLMFTGGSSNEPKVRNTIRKSEKSNKQAIQTPRKDTKSTKKRAKKGTNKNANEVVEKTTKKLKTSNKEYFKKVESDYQKNVYSKLKRPADRTDMVIRYYKKEKDEDKVSALKNLGFYVHERPSEERYASLSSNAIFYGDSIKNSDIEIIAYTLYKAGLDLKIIAPSIYRDTWKAHSLEIGTDTTAINLPNLKLSDIRKQWGQN